MTYKKERPVKHVEIRKGPLSDELRILLDQYPREAWEGHPNFKDLTRQWMRAHDMFRHLSSTVRRNTEQFLDRAKSEDDYARRLSHYGSRLVGYLHGHHSWEDYEFFPELSRTDSRFDRGLEILEQDHVVLDDVLNNFTDDAHELLQIVQQQNSGYRDKLQDIAGKLLYWSNNIEMLLDRHLADEEDLIVPIVIHHKIRG
ncbi:MAG: hemerythrin domain-containing protein [Rhizobiaceae bacterium]|nr:hemerythrin domain-containing protein [Rhizobiaceae bacterium]